MDDTKWLATQFVRVWPFLEPAAERMGGAVTWETVWEQLQKGEAQLWPLPEAGVVTTIETHPTGLKELVGWLAGGDLEQIKASVPAIETFAKDQGCDRIAINGRRGWLKAFDGYKELSTVMVKELENGQ